MKQLVVQETGEIGWHGTVTRVNDTTFKIEDIFVYPQTVTAATVTTDQVEYSNWLMQQPDEVFNNLRFQGHSHVNMGVSPSGTDNELYSQILQQLQGEDYYIFMIINKPGLINVWIHDLKTNTIYEKDDINVSIALDDDCLLHDWATEQKDMLSTPTYRNSDQEFTSWAKKLGTRKILDTEEDDWALRFQQERIDKKYRNSVGRPRKQ